MSGSALLSISGLCRSFGGLAAVDDFSLDILSGEIVSIIGPNGAGKTTAFNLITGVYPPSGGSIVFRERAIAGMSQHRIATAGIGRTFQNLRIFPNLTVFDNVRVGLTRQSRSGMVGACLRLPGFRREERRLNDEAQRLIELLRLAHVRDHLARQLPYGDQRRVEIARALANAPQLLLLDEPAAGMTQPEIHDLNGLIRRLRDDLGATILIVEHHMSLVMEISDRVVVMDQGRKIAEGAPAQVRANPVVIDAYLGTGTL